MEPLGLIGKFRFNHLHPPFDNPAVRRAILPAFSQEEYMLAANGDDRSLWRTGVGYFCPGTPMASEAGLEALQGQLRSLQQRMEALEPVNMLALEELEQLEARLAELAERLEVLANERQ
jgi:peptide/nickel transport system substrate-binding protein